MGFGPPSHNPAAPTSPCTMQTTLWLFVNHSGESFCFPHRSRACFLSCLECQSSVDVQFGSHTSELRHTYLVRMSLKFSSGFASPPTHAVHAFVPFHIFCSFYPTSTCFFTGFKAEVRMYTVLPIYHRIPWCYRSKYLLCR